MKRTKQKINIAIIACLCLSFVYSNAQILSPKVTPTCGGYFSNGGISLSSTIGEPFHKTLKNTNHMVTQGFQQPYLVVKLLNLKAFIEGFYSGNGEMRAVLFNCGLNPDPEVCDSVTIELHSIYSPYSLVRASTGLLKTDGSAEIKFPSSLKYGTYYIVFRQRNTLETWSKNGVYFNSQSLSFDFTKQ